MSKSSRNNSNSSAPSSLTTVFNVGGRRFEISSAMFAQYPSSTLLSMVKAAQMSTNREIFLDHNPDAFSVVLDYIRYGSRVLVPKNVCAEVVRLQMRQFGLPVELVAESDDGDLPAYSNLSDKKIMGIAETVNNVLEQKVGVLVENFIYPMILDHARCGHPLLDLYLLDAKILQSQVATTIDDQVPIEWIFLTSKSLTFGTDTTTYFSSKTIESPVTNSSSDDPLVSLIKGFEDISTAHRQQLLNVIEKNKERQRLRKSDLPDVSYLIQPTVMAYLETAVVKRASIIKCVVERKDLTVRRENDFGLLESTNVIAVKLGLRLA